MSTEIAHDDKNYHTIHRLEAFSDIVMGFILAQLGVNLVMPRGAGDTFSVWASATFFVSAFILIALLWWMHHRTFSTYFVLNFATILMNFGMLGALILTLYFFECVVHVASAGQNPTVFFVLFVYTFALVYALLGGMLLFGIVARRDELTAADLRWGISQVASIPIALVFFVAVGTYAATAHRGSVVYAAIAMAAVIFVIRRVILPRWLRHKIPDAIGSRAAI
jgi:uncharacterized membrane protein